MVKGAAVAGIATLRTRLQTRAAAQEFGGKLTVWGVVSFTEAGDDKLGEQMVE